MKTHKSKILTELSKPSVSNIKKKITAQKGAPGNVAIPSGYTINTSPGPKTYKTNTLN